MSLLGLDVFVARWRLASAESVLAAQDRLELAQLEWKEQKRHWFKLMGLVLAVLALAVLSLVVFSMALIIQFWDTPQRVLVAWLVAGGWVIVWAAMLATLVSVAQRAGSGFALTRSELAHDWRDIKERL